MILTDTGQLLAMLAAGVFGGFIGGFIGVTPGGILVPALTLLTGSQHQAQAISLVAQLFPTSLAGYHAYRQAGHAAQLRTVLLIAAGFIPGAFIGAKAAFLLSDRVLRWTFVAYLAVLAVSLALRRKAADGGVPPNAAKNLSHNVFVLIVVGIIAGGSSGLLGIGGGLAIVALLGVLLAVPQHEGQAISLAVSALPLALPAVAVYAHQSEVPWIASAVVIVGLLVGTWVGAKVATTIHAASLRRYFIILVSILAVFMGYRVVATQ